MGWRVFTSEGPVFVARQQFSMPCSSFPGYRSQVVLSGVTHVACCLISQWRCWAAVRDYCYCMQPCAFFMPIILHQTANAFFPSRLLSFVEPTLSTDVPRGMQRRHCVIVDDPRGSQSTGEAPCGWAVCDVLLSGRCALCLSGCRRVLPLSSLGCCKRNLCCVDIVPQSTTRRLCWPLLECVGLPSTHMHYLAYV